MIKILNLDCFQVLKEMKPVRMIFADPPDNIGLGYNEHKDLMCSIDYRMFMNDLIWAAVRKCEVFWLSYNVRHWCMVGAAMDNFLIHNQRYKAKPFVQTFTFGQHRQSDFGNNHRLMVRIQKKCEDVYTDAIRVESWRQKHGDKRADPRGRVPGDVFDIPRVTGNSAQRRTWHPTQLHEDLYERCIKSCCIEGDTVCDLFAGTGTLARVAERCKVDALLVEIDPLYCAKIAEEHNLEYDNE